MPRDIFVPMGKICVYPGGQPCVFFDKRDWLSKEETYCVHYEQQLAVDATTTKGLRCGECIKENPDKL